MKNRDIERYNLSDDDKATLRRLRNVRRKMKRSRSYRRSRAEGYGQLPRDVQRKITELQLNGK
jgi:hypothetical protein